MRQRCERPFCANDALVMADDGAFLCELHAPVDEQRRY